MFSWKNILGMFLCLVMIFSIVIVAGCNKEEKFEGNVKIGVLIPSSGPAASLGTMFKTGIQFVLDEIEQSGGIKSLDGAQIDVVWADDEANPSTSATEMERLLTSQGVCCVIGPFGTGCSLSASSLSDKYKIPTISLFGGPSDKLASLELSYWRTISPGVQSGDYGVADVNFLNYLIDNNNIKHDRIAVITIDDASGNGMRNAILQQLEEVGLDSNIVLDQRVSPTATDLTPYVLQAKAADPDVQISFLEYPTTSAAWVKAMNNAEYYPPIYINGTELLWSSFREQMVTSQIYDDVFRDGHTAVFGTPILNQSISIDSCQEFATKFVAYCNDNGLSPSMIEMEGPAIAAQAMYVLWDALEKAGSVEPEKINEALQNLKIDEDDPHFIVPVFAPAIEWDSNGGMKNYSPIMCQIQDNEKVIVWPENLAQAEPRL
jgi:branched-chain amino acid transport system substrate-binding protein